MQLLVRGLQGGTRTVFAEADHTVGELKAIIEAKSGVPARELVLSAAGRPLDDDGARLCATRLAPGATLHASGRLRGGAPVVVKMMTPHLPCGASVTIDIGAGATKEEIKAKLEAATGVPRAHQKVMLSGINQIVMGDTRTHIGYSYCGTANGVQMAVNK